jgi:hypothetical protein
MFTGEVAGTVARPGNKHHTPFPLDIGGMRRVFSGLPARASESPRHENCQHPIELEIM